MLQIEVWIIEHNEKYYEKMENSFLKRRLKTGEIVKSQNLVFQFAIDENCYCSSFERYELLQIESCIITDTR